MYLLPLTFLAAPSCNAFGIVAVCAMAVRRDSWLPRATKRALFSKLLFRTIETIRYTARMRNVSITRVPTRTLKLHFRARVVLESVSQLALVGKVLCYGSIKVRITIVHPLQ